MTTDDSVQRRKTFKDVIRNFTPAWFAVIMGTSAISIIFQAFPYGTGTQPLRILALIFFLLNLTLFIVFTLITFLRYVLFPDIWSIMLYHPVQSLYTSTFPMGVATLISVSASLLVQSYGWASDSFIYFLWGLWWTDILISIACCWGLLFWMQTSQNHSLQSMTAAWLLPVVTVIVASSTGNILAPLLPSDTLGMLTATVSLVLVICGLSLALMILTAYLLRLVVHGLPPVGSIISVFLPLGPTGQAGYSFILVGRFFKQQNLLSHGEVIHIITVCVAFTLWSLATMYLLFALFGIFYVVVRKSQKIPFKVPFWGLIFPNGVYANLTITLSTTLSSPFFRVWGSIWGVVTILLWFYVAGRTVKHAWTREIFEAPCLEEVVIGTRACIGDAQRKENGQASGQQ